MCSYLRYVTIYEELVREDFVLEVTFSLNFAAKTLQGRELAYIIIKHFSEFQGHGHLCLTAVAVQGCVAISHLYNIMFLIVPTSPNHIP